MDYIMSLDGGGTKLSCLLSNEAGRLVGEGIGGSTNSNFNSPEDIRAAMNKSISEALSLCHIDRKQVTRLYAALPVNAGLFQTLARDVLHPDIHIYQCSEFEMSLFGAIQSDYGGLVQAGTGSFAALRFPRDGNIACASPPALQSKRQRDGYYTVGGWGAIFGDEGSGFWIGREALIRFFEIMDGRREPSSLQNAMFEFFHTDKTEDIVHAIYAKNSGLQRRLVASLCPLVGRLARENEQYSQEILLSASTILAQQMSVAITRAQIQESFCVSVAGGVWKCHPLLFQNFKKEIENKFSNVVVKVPMFEPVVGGILLGLRDAGMPINERMDEIKVEFAKHRFPTNLLSNELLGG